MPFIVERVEGGPLAERVAELLRNVELRTPFDKVLVKMLVREERAATWREVHLSFRLRTLDRLTGQPINIEFPERLSPRDLEALLIDSRYFPRWVFDALRRILLHELSEAFHFKGERIYDPHKVDTSRFTS